MTGCKKAETVTVIKTVTVIGTGTEDDPIREVIQYWSHDGELIGTSQELIGTRQELYGIQGGEENDRDNQTDGM